MIAFLLDAQTQAGLGNVFGHLWEHIDDVATGAGSLFVLSTAARSLPEPVPMGSRFYLFFYRFAQAIVANWDKANVKTAEEPPAKP